MPIPYMGSKRVVGQYIYRAIANRESKGLLADPFCGGFAISEIFLKNGWRVMSSDKNKYVVALIKAVVSKDPAYISEGNHPHFYTREEFYDIAVNNPDNYPDWLVGYVQCIFSFGNQQRSYMFSREIEKYKLAGHKWAVENDDNSMREIFGKAIPERWYQGVAKLDSWQKRRLAIRKVVSLLNIHELSQLQNLERLQQLERLESCSYEDAKIPTNAVIYCDPPYANTGEYAENNFDSAKFWRWAEEKAKHQPVYVSEYTAPDGWVSILDLPRKSTMAAEVSELPEYIEKLYIRKECK